MFTNYQITTMEQALTEDFGPIRYGTTVNFEDEYVEVPDIFEIYKRILIPFSTNGLRARRVRPKRANCVIRIYRDTCLLYNKKKYWIYGTDVFIKKLTTFYSLEDGKKINYRTYDLPYLFDAEDPTKISLSFVDFFVYVH